MVDIPEKSYFKIGEVSKIVGVEPYNIRYWESQFRAIRPAKTKSKQRLYKRRDIETLLKIKKLLYEEGFTISGAKKRLRNLSTGPGLAPPGEAQGQLGMATEERQAYADLLAKSQAEVEECRARVEQLTEDLRITRRECTEKLRVVEAERTEFSRLLKEAEEKIRDLSEQGGDSTKAASADLHRLESERADLMAQLEAVTRERDTANAQHGDSEKLRQVVTEKEQALFEFRRRHDLLINKLEVELRSASEMLNPKP